MVNYGFIILPLYIYPTPGAWRPLFDAAKAYPDVDFYAVINPSNGPGAGTCPNADYISALNQLHTISNINALGYVHTANKYDCGSSGTDICTCSAPLSELEANITTYQSWPTAGCAKAKDIHVDGIFIDESPSASSCEQYMRSVTSYAKNTLTRGNTVLFNAGTGVDEVYWEVADYINVFENTGAAYRSADVSDLDRDGVYSQQATMIIYGYTGGAKALKKDVNTILSVGRDAIAGLYVSNGDSYSEFPTNWGTFVKDVAAVVRANKAS